MLPLFPDHSFEERGYVATAMQDAHDPNAGIGNTVHDELMSHKEAAITRMKICTIPASVRVLSEKREVARQEIDETVGGGFIPFSDVNPDGEDIAACSAG